MKTSNDEKRITLQRELERQRKAMQKNERKEDHRKLSEKKPPSDRR